jgi:hypothetical protein
MKRISTTNSHKYLDRQLRQLYAEENPHDEICFHLGIEFDDTLRPKQTWKGLVVDGPEVNHIFSFGRRPDIRSNLISLSRNAHRFFHAHLKVGRLLCLVAKARKAHRTGELEEFSLSDLDFCSGRSMAGFVECLELSELWLKELKAELMERIMAMREGVA